MKKVSVHFPPISLQRDAYFQSAHVDVIAAYYAGLSRSGPVVELPDDMGAQKACEELFDLSNNPGRIDARDLKYGEYRSVSTGDIVAIEGGDVYLCKSVGWEKLTKPVAPATPEQRAELARADTLLSAEELEIKYGGNGDGEHPRFLCKAWRAEVAAGNTRRGYWAWVEGELDEEIF